MSEKIANDIRYHERRAEQERHFAKHARSNAAQHIHIMLSKLHEMMRYDLSPDIDYTGNHAV